MRIRSCIRNFFSWASVRALFREAAKAGQRGPPRRRPPATSRCMQANFRNTRAVTALANRLLKIKQARFGSVDRESNFLVKCASHAAGEVRLLKAEEKGVKLGPGRVVTHASVPQRGDCFARWRTKRPPARIS